ncbi:DEAD/DEAH box helicase [Acidaminobacter hydrogenoformans]|nr:DEAD/DEAH box helicase [Acidaminobacter hydrogenoformans]
MRQHKRVYRFIEGDIELERFLNDHFVEEEAEYQLGRTFNREGVIADPTPLEYRFEECFAEAYGEEALKFIKREYAFITEEGRTAYVDYALFKKDGTWIAIEENGVMYHHPNIIGKAKYRQILKKQNSVIAANGIVFRWDTESLANREKIVDELKEFIGDINDYLIQYAMVSQRGFVLHEHQTDYLNDLSVDRSEGKGSALVVLPTGTGKTTIALEDMKRLADSKGKLNALVLAPTLDLTRQWEREAKHYQNKVGKIEVVTYASAARQYYKDAPGKYHYVVVDEAHHGVAPVLKKAIQHYQPDFMLGLTATDKRLDARKLESVFGSYEEKLDLRQAIEKGLLCQIRAFRLESNIDLSEVRFNGKDYVSADLERRIRVSSRNELIVDVLHKYFYTKLPGKSGLIFCVSVAHAKEMARLLKARGFGAESVDGKDYHRQQKIEKYMKQEIQFLCTCSLLSEGWDAPHTSVIVMARPTLSKVLYTQQLGRGTRLAEGKEALYVIDVVDQYGSFGQVSNRPWSVHGLFGLEDYQVFGNLFMRTGDASEELVLLETTHESLVKLQPFELFTMQKVYEDYLSVEMLARELFVSTGTVNSWLIKGEIKADVTIPMGRSSIKLFRPAQVVEIRQLKGLSEHTEETLVDDFWAFIDERTYTYSYKMYFMLSLLENVDSTGDADIQGLMERYRVYYLERHEKGLMVDRENCPYGNMAYIMDDKVLIKSILSNPFEKFERKRFMYYAKDLKKISFHHRIWDALTQGDGLERLRSRMLEDLKNYYEPLGGL